MHKGIRFTKMDMCKSVNDYQKKNLCISATLKSCVLALDKASASQVLATKQPSNQASPHLSASSHHFRLLLHTQLPSRILKQKVLLKLRRDNNMMRKKLITNYLINLVGFYQKGFS